MANLLAKFYSSIAAPITPTALSIVLDSVTDIPTVPFMGILDHTKDDAECVWVTAVDVVAKTLTVTRAQRDTTAVAHAKGTLLYNSEVALADLGFFEVWETADETGRPLESQLRTNVRLGAYANAIKGYVDCDESGGSIGLLSGVNGEIRLPDAAGRGAYFALEGEMVFQTSSTVTPYGSTAGFLHLGSGGDGKTAFDEDGVFMSVWGLTPLAGYLLSADSHTLKCDIYTNPGHLDRYLLLSEEENRILWTGTPGADNPKISLGEDADTLSYAVETDRGMEIHTTYTLATRAATGVTFPHLAAFNSLEIYNIYDPSTATGVGSTGGLLVTNELATGKTFDVADLGFLYGIEGRINITGILDGAGVVAAAVMGVIGENVTGTTEGFADFQYLTCFAAYTLFQEDPKPFGIYTGFLVANAGGYQYSYGFFLQAPTVYGLGLDPRGGTMQAAIQIDASHCTTIDNVISLIDTADINYFLETGTVSVTGCIQANTHAIDTHNLQHIITVIIDSDVGFIPVFAAVPA